MEKDVLIILMIAFGLFAIIMFVLFYVYLRKYYNNKHINDNYEKEIDNESDEDVIGQSGIDDNPVFPPLEEKIERMDENPKDEYVSSESYDTSTDEYNIDDVYDDEGFVPVKK